ncbi:hypothetical protein Poli38472_004986 [Pythium oligandrum]|uniref:Uncharacterized protein n=1 Tax=Pythium oligandrum TaxID=41045 RepID=A0A8K1CB35_PYTOL|nr:hypothetical protein Poli38472_004986 [Pythium oligandrum]|eukprot:TMW59917.1 hypothetical protein Poli38472_004986 [Pythium oligandrum]
MEEYSLLEDAVALMDACEPFPLDFGLEFGANAPREAPLSSDEQSTGDEGTASSTASTAMVARGRRNQASKHGAEKTPTKNASRERLKAELVFLRDKVVELEQELSDLRHKHEEAVTSNPSTTTAIAPVWRRIAERQLDRRRNTEAENQRLRNTLDAQIRVAKSLEHMLRKRSSATMVNLYEGARGSRKRARLANDMDMLYVQFLAEIETAYQNVDKIFEINGLTNQFDETIRGYTLKTRQVNDHEEMYIMLKDVKIVPFAMERATRAIWKSVVQEYTQGQRTVLNFRDEADRFAARFQAKGRSHTTEGLLNVTIVMRQFIEVHRMVLVWRATNTSAEDEHADWENMYTDETGWMVVRPLPDAKTGAPGETVAMQSCVHVVPRWFDSSSSPSSPDAKPPQLQTGDFTKLVINSYEEDVIAITEAVENLLVDESISAGSALM